MYKSYIFIANWKMKFDFSEELEYANSMSEEFIALANNEKTKIVLAPSFLSLYPISQIFKDTKVEISAQDCSTYNRGAYTGQISAQSLTFLECSYCIIGHSERRIHNKETDIDIAEKCGQLLMHKISPIICIGETLDEYNNGQTLNVLEKQLEKIFDIIKKQPHIPTFLTINIAYEPIWAIGSGKIPNFDHLENIFLWISTKIEKNAKNINYRLVYGGSVNSLNIVNLKKINLIDGFLLGNSSLNFTEFEKIVKLENT